MSVAHPKLRRTVLSPATSAGSVGNHRASANSSQRVAKPGRPLAFDKAIHARRNIVERFNNRLKQWCSLATRYEKRAVNYRAMLVLASIVLWLDP